MSLLSTSNQVANAPGGKVIQIAHVHSLAIHHGQPGTRLRLVRLQPQARATLGSLQVDAPSHLLDSQSAVVTYQERPDVESTLTEWLDSAPAVSVAWLSGEGGAGKTRLAERMATKADALGWACFQADGTSSDLPAGDADDPPTHTDSVVIVDYADRWPLTKLAGLVRQVAEEANNGGRVRLLMLARTGTHHRADLEAAVGREVRDHQVIPMPPFTKTVSEAWVAFTQAHADFQDALGRPRSSPVQPPELGDMSTPLDVSMTALAAVLSESLGGVDYTPDLSSFLLGHERRYWLDCEIGVEAMADVVLVATLSGGASSHEEALILVDGVARCHGIDAMKLLLCHHRYYPASDGRYLAPLLPELLGDDYLRIRLDEHGLPGEHARSLVETLRKASAR